MSFRFASERIAGVGRSADAYAPPEQLADRLNIIHRMAAGGPWCVAGAGAREVHVIERLAPKLPR